MNETKSAQLDYFRQMFREHGGSPMSVSSESLAHKQLRFSKIAQLFGDEAEIEVHDIGMGLGDFNVFLHDYFPNKTIHYSGSDILEEYVFECSRKFPESKFFLRDIAEQSFDDKHDYVAMSGVFHQKRESTIPQFERFWQDLLTNTFSMCNKGLAFNFVSPFVDFYQPQVYYCNLQKLLTFVNDKLSRFFRIDHNYALYEFTVFVYNENYIKDLYQNEEFTKYFKI